MKTYFISYTVQSNDGEIFLAQEECFEGEDQLDVRSYIVSIKKRYSNDTVAILACNPI